jgi:hypothetical protein
MGILELPLVLLDFRVAMMRTPFASWLGRAGGDDLSALPDWLALHARTFYLLHWRRSLDTSGDEHC